MKKIKFKIKLILFYIKIFFLLRKFYEPFIYKNEKLSIKRAKRLGRIYKQKFFVVKVNDLIFDIMDEKQWKRHKEIINDPVYKDLLNDKLIYGNE